MSQQDKIRLFANFILQLYGAMAILFQLITGIKPPKLRDLMSIE